MLKRSTLQLLRFHFSLFLMPVFWFAISQVPDLDITDSVLIFFILHGLVYPSSNGYNSYMDRDTGPIGGLQNPAMPEKELFRVTIVMDIVALILSLLVSIYFTAAVILFIVASRAYSYRGIRLKKFPLWGYLTVIIFQGALVFFAVYHGSSSGKTLDVPTSAMLASSLLIGAFYPLTQVYQHEADAADGVRSISASLGYRGTFMFSAGVFALAMMALAWYFGNNLELDRFFIIQICMLPALVYFLWWMIRVFKNTATADFKNTMNMNFIGSMCTNLAFISILILDKL